MKNKSNVSNLILSTLALLSILMLSACGSSGQTASSCDPYKAGTGTGTKVLIVGDSISIGYTCTVQEQLGTRGYDVSRITDNAKNTTYTLAHIDQWLADAKPKIVIWNNGLWNSTLPTWRNSGEPDTVYSTDINQYQYELGLIAQKITATGARVIFMTTTDINPAAIWFRAGFETDMNNVAKAMLPYYGVDVYDLNAVAKTIPQLHMSPDNVHFVDAGYQIFGSFVVNAVTGGS